MTDAGPVARRWPVIPTILVALAVLTMIALGVWQWQRKGEKEALLALYARNAAMSSEVMFPVLAPVPDSAQFRRSTVVCLSPESWRVIAGRAAGGAAGFRYIADCRVGVEGPGALVDMGVGQDPQWRPDWKGGSVSGMITLDPEQPGLLAKIFTRPAPPRAMLVSAAPAPGLKASALPDPKDVPNNHIAYAGQWWLFAFFAAVIYVLALRRRWAVKA